MWGVVVGLEENKKRRRRPSVSDSRHRKVQRPYDVPGVPEKMCPLEIEKSTLDDSSMELQLLRVMMLHRVVAGSTGAVAELLVGCT